MSGNPPSGSKVREAPDREIGKSGENRRKVVAHRDFQPAAAFHDRQNRSNLRSCQWTADVQPNYVHSRIMCAPEEKKCMIPQIDGPFSQETLPCRCA
jgi:hypothetical protein